MMCRNDGGSVGSQKHLVVDEHCWFSGRILACHAGDRGSIPRQCKIFNSLFECIESNVGKQACSTALPYRPLVKLVPAGLEPATFRV